jgi:hypothetical protein
MNKMKDKYSEDFGKRKTKNDKKAKKEYNKYKKGGPKRTQKKSKD